MKRTLIITTAAAALLGAGAEAYLGQVVGSFPSPAGTNTRGLARATGAYLYVLDGNNRANIYRLRPITGSVFGYYTVSWSGANAGLAYSTPSYLWVGNASNNRVYRTEAGSGSVYASWNAGHDPFGLAPQCTGDGGAGTVLLLSTDEGPRRLFFHSLTNGSILNSVVLPHSSRNDCAYDWRNKLIWRGYASYIYGYTPSGTVAGSFPSPASSPRGLTYLGQYLWIACNGDGYIYRVHCPQNFTAVEPSSLGRLRVIFR